MARAARRSGQRLDHPQRAVVRRVPRARRSAITRPASATGRPRCAPRTTCCSRTGWRCARCARAARRRDASGITLNLAPVEPAAREPRTTGQPRCAWTATSIAGSSIPLFGRATRRTWSRCSSGAARRWTAVQAGDLAPIAAPHRLPRRQLLHAERRAQRSRGTGRSAATCRSPAARHDRDGLGGRPRRARTRLLLRVHRDYATLPIYITENGAAFDDGPVDDGTVDDAGASAYLRDHLARAGAGDRGGRRRARLLRVVAARQLRVGARLRKRFGIVRVDYETQRRIPKRSGLWYRDYIARARNGGGA